MEIDKKEMEDDKGKIKYRGIKAMPYVIGNETFEKLGTIGTLSNLLVYLTTVFNMSSIDATNVVNIFNGTASFGTLLGAFLCDTYFGRYKTLGFACVASVLGMLVLTLTAAIPHLHPQQCNASSQPTHCRGPTTGQMSFLIGGLSLLVVGAGGIRPCNLAFGADQFDPNTESGKRGISSFFNWYYFTLTFAIMISVTFVVYIQSSISWAIGLAIPAIFMLVSSGLFFVGSKIYVKVQPNGSPLVSVVQVVVAAVRKRGLKLEKEGGFEVGLFECYVAEKSINSKLSHTDQFRFLDKAAIITEQDRINPDGSSSDPWRLCSIQQVEVVKCLVRVLPIWLSNIMYNVSTVTMGNYIVFQALQCNRNLGHGNFKIPAASYTIFTMLTITIWIPFYDRIIVPKLRKITGKPEGITVLQKLGVGIFLLIIALVVCGLVEHARRGLSATTVMSGMWLVPPLTLAGLSEAFAMVASVEFYYKQFPENMRSIGAAFLFCGMAMASYLSSFLQSVVVKVTTGPNRVTWLAQDLNKGRLDYFYYLLAGLELVNFFYFLVCSKWYRYRESDNKVTDGEVDEKKSEVPLV